VTNSTDVTLAIEGTGVVVQDTLTDVPSGETETATLDVSTAGIAPGTYDVVVQVSGDEFTTTITVEAGSPLSAYANDQGVVDDSGLSAAIDDWVSGEIDDDLLSQAIDAWVSGDPVV
jgi:hypothetical protein